MANSAVVGLLRVLLSADSAEFETAMGRASDSAKVWSREFRKVGAQAQAVGAALTKTITLPLVGIGAGAIKMASDFESSFAGVRKTVDGTAAELEVLKTGIRDMAKEIPATADDLNRVAEAAGQLGIRREDILGFTRVMADLGVSTNLTADEAATMTAQFQNIFGAAGKDVDRFGATLVALGNAGASTEREILEMGLRIAGAGQQVGLTQGQVLGLANALASVGINAEAGGSSISRAFLKMNDAVMAGAEATQEWARVAGMGVQEFRDLFERDAAAAMTKFIQGLARLKGEGENVNQTLEGLVGKNILIKDTLLRAAGAGDLLEQSLELQGKAWKENAALTKEAEERYKTFESQLTILWNQVKDVGITIGTSLLPVLKDLITVATPIVGAVGKLAEWFAKLPEPVRLAAVGIAGLVAAVGPATWAFGQLASSAAAVIGAFKAGGILATAATWLHGIRIAGMGAGASLGAVGVAVASLTSIVYAGSQAWGLYRDRQEQAKLATAQNYSFQRTMAEASKLAGRQVTDHAEALKILQENAARLRAEQDNGKPAIDAATAAQRAAEAEARKLAAALEAAAGATDRHTGAAGRNSKAVDKQREALTAAAFPLIPFVGGLEDAETASNRAGESLHDLASGSLAETAAETEAARKETEAWAEASGARLPAAVRMVGPALDEVTEKALTFRESMRAAFSKLPEVILGAIKGGGNIGQAIGASLFGGMFAEGSALVGKITGGLSKALGPALGGALGSIIPGLGTLLGSGLGKAVSGAIGKLFKSEGRKVNDLRDAAFASAGGFEALHARLEAAGFSMERLLKVSKQADWDREWKAAQAALEEYEGALEGLNAEFSETVEAVAGFGPAALEGFGPAIEELGRMGKLSGENLERFRQLAGGTEVDFERMQRQAEKYGISLGALGPRFEGARIAAEAGDLVNVFTELERNGGDVGGMLVGVKDEIAGLVQRAIAAGAELPAQMKPWIEELARTGQLVDENGKALEGLGDLKFGEPIKTEFEKATDRLAELIEKLTGPLLQAIDRIPNRVPVRFEGSFRWNDGEGMPQGFNPDIPEMATGGIVRRPTIAMIGERGAEAIVPLGPDGGASKLGGADPELRAEVAGLRRDLRDTFEALRSTLAITLRDAAMGRV